MSKFRAGLLSLQPGSLPQVSYRKHGKKACLGTAFMVLAFVCCRENQGWKETVGHPGQMVSR